MAWAYRLGLWRRLVNRIVHVLLRVGVSPPHTYLLTVRGRKTGQPYSTPVTLVEKDGERWLVAPYGEVAVGAKRSCSQAGYANAWSQIRDCKESAACEPAIKAR